MPYTLSFGHPDATQHDLVGGKGANLARLTQAGFVVPPGFVVTTEAYRAFLQKTGLEERLRTLIPDFAYSDADMLEKQPRTSAT